MMQQQQQKPQLHPELQPLVAEYEKVKKGTCGTVKAFLSFDNVAAVDSIRVRVIKEIVHWSILRRSVTPSPNCSE